MKNAFDPDGNVCFPPSHPATEAERDDTSVSDRERVRRVVHVAIEIFLATVFDTPPDLMFDDRRHLLKFNNIVESEVKEYRRSQKQRRR